jgi:hypothetical protein
MEEIGGKAPTRLIFVSAIPAIPHKGCLNHVFMEKNNLGDSGVKNIFATIRNLSLSKYGNNNSSFLGQDLNRVVYVSQLITV